MGSAGARGGKKTWKLAMENELSSENRGVPKPDLSHSLSKVYIDHREILKPLRLTAQ